jgi:hypothetical protein
MILIFYYLKGFLDFTIHYERRGYYTSWFH